MRTSTGALHTPPSPVLARPPRRGGGAGRADARRRPRSPYTNTYYDPEDPSAEVEGEEEYDRPSAELRKYEEAANEVFDMYRERYYSGPPAPKASLSSVYFWDPVDSEASMAGCILFHNVAETPGIQGTWDSIHVAEVTEGQGKGDLAGTCHYKLTTTVILQCDTEGEGVKNNVGGYRMQVMEKDMKNDAENTHLVPQPPPACDPRAQPRASTTLARRRQVNIGTMVQDMENKMLSQMKVRPPPPSSAVDATPCL